MLSNLPTITRLPSTGTVNSGVGKLDLITTEIR